MFDKLIVSEPEGADFKNRRGYFMVSSLVVGVLFVTAVVISIFAADFGLGNSSYELVEMIAPPETAAVEPETPQPQPPSATSQSQSQLPTRQMNIARVDEIVAVPDQVSTVPNTVQARPNEPFQIGPTDTNSGTGNRTGPPSTGPAVVEPVPVVQPQPEPRPVVPDPPKPPPVKSGGVVNGIAKSLPMPVYPAIARQARITGPVQVQVLIDESGKVVSASAVSGHPFLKPAAEKAAWGARFSTTTLSGTPVKVSGVIVYNFTM